MRLATLVGPPGVGKTRLAVEVARRAQAAFPDGVWFVDLTFVTDPGLVPTTMAAAAEIRTHGAESVTDALAVAWQDARLLLVMDNFEHLVGTTAAHGIACVLASCPGVSILTTSRVPLQVRGEREVPVDPLAIPTADDVVSLETVAGVSSMQLLAHAPRGQSSVRAHRGQRPRRR